MTITYIRVYIIILYYSKWKKCMQNKCCVLYHISTHWNMQFINYSVLQIINSNNISFCLIDCLIFFYIVYNCDLTFFIFIIQQEYFCYVFLLCYILGGKCMHTFPSIGVCARRKKKHYHSTRTLTPLSVQQNATRRNFW